MRAKPKSTITYFLRLQWLVIPTTLALMVWADRIVLRYHSVCLEERYCFSERELKIRALTSALLSHSYLFESHLDGVHMKSSAELTRAAERIIDYDEVVISARSIGGIAWHVSPLSRLLGKEMTAFYIASPHWPQTEYPTGATFVSFPDPATPQK